MLLFLSWPWPPVTPLLEASDTSGNDRANGATQLTIPFSSVFGIALTIDGDMPT